MKSCIWLLTFAITGAPADPKTDSEMTFSRMDRNDDGHVDRSEFDHTMVQRAELRFADLDADADGALSTEEAQPAIDAAKARRAKLPRFVRRRLPEPKTFVDMDTDKDGKLTLKEWTAAGADRRRRFFDRADKNDDSVLSQAEVDALIERLKRFSAE